MELRDKVGKVEEASVTMTGKEASIRSEALNALLSLGYTRVTAEAALRAVLQNTKDLSLEEVIKQALRLSSR